MILYIHFVLTQAFAFDIIKKGGETKMTFANKLKLIRKTNNLTQSEFAESIGISRGNLSGLELGKVSPTPLLINCVSLMYNFYQHCTLKKHN